MRWRSSLMADGRPKVVWSDSFIVEVRDLDHDRCYFLSQSWKNKRCNWACERDYNGHVDCRVDDGHVPGSLKTQQHLWQCWPFQKSPWWPTSLLIALRLYLKQRWHSLCYVSLVLVVIASGKQGCIAFMAAPTSGLRPWVFQSSRLSNMPLI